MKKYIALVGLTNDKTRKTYSPGDTITSKDFASSTLEHWAEQGKIRLVEESEEPLGKPGKE